MPPPVAAWTARVVFLLEADRQFVGAGSAKAGRWKRPAFAVPRAVPDAVLIHVAPAPSSHGPAGMMSPWSRTVPARSSPRSTAPSRPVTPPCPGRGQSGPCASWTTARGCSSTRRKPHRYATVDGQHAYSGTSTARRMTAGSPTIRSDCCQLFPESRSRNCGSRARRCTRLPPCQPWRRCQGTGSGTHGAGGSYTTFRLKMIPGGTGGSSRTEAGFRRHLPACCRTGRESRGTAPSRGHGPGAPSCRRPPIRISRNGRDASRPCRSSGSTARRAPTARGAPGCLPCSRERTAVAFAQGPPRSAAPTSSMPACDVPESCQSTYASPVSVAPGSRRRISLGNPWGRHPWEAPGNAIFCHVSRR